MSRPLIVRALAVIVAASCVAACGRSSSPPPHEVVTVTRPAGSWHGTGNMTIGFVSESGRFRVTWQTRHEHPPHTGTFRLTVHSAVSGRPIQIVADHRGEGSAAADVADDPRPYNLMVESTNLEWSITVDEHVAGHVPQR